MGLNKLSGHAHRAGIPLYVKRSHMMLQQQQSIVPTTQQERYRYQLMVGSQRSIYIHNNKVSVQRSDTMQYIVV